MIRKAAVFDSMLWIQRARTLRQWRRARYQGRKISAWSTARTPRKRGPCALSRLFHRHFRCVRSWIYQDRQRPSPKAIPVQRSGVLKLNQGHRGEVLRFYCGTSYWFDVCCLAFSAATSRLMRAGNHKNSGLNAVAGTLEKEFGSGTLIRAAPHTKYAMRLQTNDARQLDVTYLGPDGAIRGFHNEPPA